jgi:hypothetical protein
LSSIFYFGKLKTDSRGNCKTPAHGKNDDFESVCQPQSDQSGKMAQKGVFAMRWSFAIASQN